MATTLTNMNETLIVNKIVGALKNGLIPINAFSFDVTLEGRVQNDVMRVPVVTDATPQSKTPGTALTSNGSAATTSITLASFYEAVWQLNEAQINPARASAMFAEFAAGATHGLCKQVIDAATALVTAANYGDDSEDKLTCTPADFGQKDLGDLLSKAETKKLGRQRSLILNGDYAGAIIGESSLGLILATSGDNALKTGVMPPLMGFTTYMYGGLGTNSAGLGGFLCDKAAIAVAIAPPALLAASGEGDMVAAEMVTEPESGITVAYKRWYDSAAGSIFGSVALLYGVGKVQDSAIRIVNG